MSAKLSLELAKSGSFSPAVLKAFELIDRNMFVPDGLGKHSHKLGALPITGNQWISSPLTVAKMTEALRPQGADSVLEIGCGSGYQAAILSKLFRRVFTIERIEALLIEARGAIKKAGLYNINTKLDDGNFGWAEYAPYDRILFSACADEIPKKLFEQLSENGGILVAPMTKGRTQVIARFIKNRAGIVKEEIEECKFVPVLSGIERC